ncbi:MAG TPA: penicillin-binding transpeptidase domain-containing protein, partial [Thermoanaerobaculia bacterium]
LEAVMAGAGFDSEADLGAFRVPLGKTKVAIHDYDYSIATYAVGLEHLSINALHLAMIGAAVANGGTMTSPRLIRGRRSVLGDSLAFPTRSTSRSLASPAATRKVIESMKAVVTNPRGTGRRAAVPGLTIAMKTGTAGQSVPGFNALIVGFAPADEPRIAFGMILEHAGPAEFAGAKATADFFAQLRDRL